ncbi:MAG TPA: DUF2934 domain-containing protein [Acidobacteriaceae bacterium]|jgi:hypothetical protein|nr:DUF2934 domain-containing protein [Acidobacteriaceae bacterium]
MSTIVPTPAGIPTTTTLAERQEYISVNAYYLWQSLGEPAGETAAQDIWYQAEDFVDELMGFLNQPFPAEPVTP